jgi:hypothetical protein
MSMKNSNDTIENRTRDFPAFSAVHQPSAPPGIDSLCGVSYLRANLAEKTFRSCQKYRVSLNACSRFHLQPLVLRVQFITNLKVNFMHSSQKIGFTLEHALKAQKGSRDIAFLFF